MASKKTQINDVIKKTRDLKLNENDNIISIQTSDFYPNRKDKINFARLEKGLLLFIYIYETAKNTLASEITLWDHRLCLYLIKDGKCSKSSDQCHREHQTTYRQSNLCSYWYINNSCTFGTKCKNVHQFQDISKYHRYIRNETEVHVYKLIRFVRNFAGHYIDSVITNANDQQDLYKTLIIVMVHLVHFLSPKNTNSIEHLNLFLEATTINQLISEKDLLNQIEKPYAIPKIFFDLNMNFNTYWYQHDGDKQLVDFKQLSTEFITFFNQIFIQYFEGRLKSRGAKAAWS